MASTVPVITTQTPTRRQAVEPGIDFPRVASGYVNSSYCFRTDRQTGMQLLCVPDCFVVVEDGLCE